MLDPAAVVRTDVLFVVHDKPPSYEYAIRFVPPPAAEFRIAPPPTAIKKFREYTCDHVAPSAPLEDRVMTLVVSVPPPGNKPCARPTPPRNIAPEPTPAPALVFIPVVNNEIGIFAYATALVFTVGVNIVFAVLFQELAAVISLVYAICENPEPHDIIHE
jgi:hypothetical protein